MLGEQVRNSEEHAAELEQVALLRSDCVAVVVSPVCGDPRRCSSCSCSRTEGQSVRITASSCLALGMQCGHGAGGAAGWCHVPRAG